MSVISIYRFLQTADQKGSDIPLLPVKKGIAGIGSEHGQPVWSVRCFIQKIFQVIPEQVIVDLLQLLLFYGRKSGSQIFLIDNV